MSPSTRLPFRSRPDAAVQRSWRIARQSVSITDLRRSCAVSAWPTATRAPVLMARSESKRRRICRLASRSSAGVEPVPKRGAGRDLIVRWIGAAAMKRRKSARHAANTDLDLDTVTSLTWAQTFGRDVNRTSSGSNLSAEVLEIRARTDTLCAQPVFCVDACEARVRFQS